MYGKHFQSMYTGSMCGSGAAVFAVWGYVIAHVRDNTCELNPAYLAFVLGMEEKQVIQAIEFLCSPDSKSRGKEFDGRRLIREGEYQYRVPQAEHYRKIRSSDDQREANRERQHRYRMLHSVTPLKTDVTKSNDISEAEAEAESKKKLDSSEPQSAAAEPHDPIRLNLPIVGSENKTYPLRLSQITRWRELYPDLEIFQELNKACAWLEANPSKRKTERGIKRFCLAWLERAQNGYRRPRP